MKKLSVMCSLVLFCGVIPTSIEIQGVSEFTMDEEPGAVTFHLQNTSIEIAVFAFYLNSSSFPVRLARLATVASNSSGSIGLGTWRSYPAERARRRSSWRA